MLRHIAVADLTHESANSLVAQFASRTLSPVEATKAALERIDCHNATLNAFCRIDEAGAMLAARNSEARWAHGEPLGPVDGVPCSIKDVFQVAGWPTLKGSLLTNPANLASEDSPSTARLRESGAVLLGKTTTPEFGWKATGDSPRTGSTLNPWSSAHTSGGSSAGAASSLAAGMGALAVGSDGGGSIRIPASFCGVVGIKPTQGLVPYFPRSAMGTLSHCGPLARNVQDVALMLSVLSRTDARDPYRGPAQTTDFLDQLDAGVRGLRIAYSPTLGYIKVDKEIEAAVKAAALTFSSLGAVVEQVDPGFASPRDHFNTLWKAGAAVMLAGFDTERHACVDAGLRMAAHDGMRLSGRDLVNADVFRTQLGEFMGRFHQRFDLLLTPTVAVPALLAGTELSDGSTQSEWIDWAGFSYPFNLTRQPAVSVPCGLTSRGLPIGLQIVGDLHADALVLRAAQAFETCMPATEWPMLTGFEDRTQANQR